MVMYTSLYLNWITNKVLLYSIGNSAQHYVAACMYNPIQNKKLKKNKSKYVFRFSPSSARPNPSSNLIPTPVLPAPSEVPSGILLSRPMW